MIIDTTVIAFDEGERILIWSFVSDTIRFLSKYHGVNISMSTLKRQLREYGSKRMNASYVDDNNLIETIRQELDGPSCLSGYKEGVTLKCSLRDILTKNKG